MMNSNNYIDPADCHLSELEEFGVTPRTINLLETRSIYSVRDLIMRTPEELLAIKEFGLSTLLQCVRAAKLHHNKYGPYRRKVKS